MAGPPSQRAPHRILTVCDAGYYQAKTIRDGYCDEEPGQIEKWAEYYEAKLLADRILDSDTDELKAEKKKTCKFRFSAADDSSRDISSTTFVEKYDNYALTRYEWLDGPNWGR